MVPPEAGTALISVRDADKPQAVVLARGLVDRGFRLVATRHTAEALRSAGLDCAMVNKVREGRPHVVDLIINREIALIVNTTQGREAVLESRSIRREAIHQKITYYTSVEAAHAMLTAWGHTQDFKVRPIRDWLGGGKGN
ncbi:MGS-like domain protein [mine drainage metagenome]|uniref:carbamoyl-phosphate synthase (glutamine-hydrolyzing) n=1 Tax=mine drainage metagenome TaxID=410659 RepID=T1B9H1_9ZZZZ